MTLKHLVIVIATVVIVAGFACWQGYVLGEKNAIESEQGVVTTLKPVDYNILGSEGYFITTGDKGEYELIYIANEGWFLIDKDWTPHLMYRLEVWLADHTPDGRYTYEYYVEGYRHGTISIYFANP